MPVGEPLGGVRLVEPPLPSNVAQASKILGDWLKRGEELAGDFVTAEGGGGGGIHVGLFIDSLRDVFRVSSPPVGRSPGEAGVSGAGDTGVSTFVVTASGVTTSVALTTFSEPRQGVTSEGSTTLGSWLLSPSTESWRKELRTDRRGRIPTCAAVRADIMVARATSHRFTSSTSSDLSASPTVSPGSSVVLGLTNTDAPGGILASTSESLVLWGRLTFRWGLGETAGGVDFLEICVGDDLLETLTSRSALTFDWFLALLGLGKTCGGVTDFEIPVEGVSGLWVSNVEGTWGSSVSPRLDCFLGADRNLGILVSLVPRRLAEDWLSLVCVPEELSWFLTSLPLGGSPGDFVSLGERGTPLDLDECRVLDVRTLVVLDDAVLGEAFDWLDVFRLISTGRSGLPGTFGLGFGFVGTGKHKYNNFLKGFKRVHQAYLH